MRPAWLNRELLGKLKWTRRVYRFWKEGLATWEEYKAVVRECKEATRKAKGSLELNHERGIWDNRKGFFKHIVDKTNTRGNVGPLMSEVSALETENKEKAELLNAFFIYNARGSSKEPHNPETPDKIRIKEEFALVDEGCVKDRLSKLDIRKFMGPDEMHVRELAEVIARLLSIIFGKSWALGEVPKD